MIKELSTAELYPLNILSKSRLSSKASSRLELIASQLTIVNANLDAPQIFVADQNDHRLTIIRNKHLCLGTSVCGISRLAFTNVATGLKILVFTRPNKSVYKETAASHLQGEIFQKSLVFPVEGPLLWHSLALEGNAMWGGGVCKWPLYLQRKTFFNQIWWILCSYEVREEAHYSLKVLLLMPQWKKCICVAHINSLLFGKQ